MSHYQNHSAFYDKPVLLTADEIEDPYQIIAIFFREYPLSLIRETNRNIDQACLATDVAPFEDAHERQNLMLYRWCETKLVEAAYVLLQNKSKATLAAYESNPDASVSNALKADTSSSSPPKLAAAADEQTNDLIHFGDVRRRLIDIQGKVTELRDKVVLVWGEQALAFLESAEKAKITRVEFDNPTFFLILSNIFMLQYRNHREIFDNPLHLSKEEMSEPLSVLAEFFDDYSLSEIRAFNQEIDFVCLTSDTHPFDDATQRDRLLDFRQNELRLLEAAYLLTRLDASALEAAKQLLAKKANGQPIDVADVSLKIALLKVQIHELHDCVR